MVREKATLAGGCFWCTEAVFQEVKGVYNVVSGFSGGNVDNPSYDQMHTSNTGHAECIQFEFDASVIAYSDILKIFYYTHNPTTLNQDGANYGSEYRSVIFYHDNTQKNTAEEITNGFAQELWTDPIVTEIVAYEKFWPAEDIHQNFFKNNPNQGYCQVIINPKLEKFRKKFESFLR